MSEREKAWHCRLVAETAVCARQAEYVEYLKHALCRALGCCSVADRGLSARQVDALKELVLAPACTPDLVDAIMADDAAVTGRPHRRARDTSSTASAGTQHDAVVDDSAPAEGFAKRARDRAPRMPQHAASDKPALLEHICIRVPPAPCRAVSLPSRAAAAHAARGATETLPYSGISHMSRVSVLPTAR